MFQLKLNDIELVSKPEYYRKYIIAIIGEPQMLETEGCAPVIAQRVNQHTQPYRPRADDPEASARTIVPRVRPWFFLPSAWRQPAEWPVFCREGSGVHFARKIVD
jgi:hypothetical protein